MSEGFIVVIPARFASSRLPGKPLEDIAGKPMIEWVYRRAAQSGAREVTVATDDQRIVEACRTFDAPVELTATTHMSGTDRIAELARRRGWRDEQIVVNVQGDEPLISPLSIAQVARLLRQHPEAAIATLTTPFADEADFRDPNFGKVVTDKDGWALYFSRAPIPWPRDGGMPPAQRHIGLYAYRAASLKAISAAAPCGIEMAEQLEQLRALWLGLKIIVAEGVEAPSQHVDTQEDLDKIRRYVQRTGVGP
jgi:3-deoxy-manno-octulosonate cytidylyltransferase (CMP-KDO synthetase)